MAYRPLTDIPISLLTASSEMASGYVLKAYLTNTTTPATLYSDASGTSAGISITLDARGEPTTIKRVWLDTAVTYKLVLETDGGSVVWTADPVYGATLSTPGELEVITTGGDVAWSLEDRTSDEFDVFNLIPRAQHSAIRDRSTSYDATSKILEAVDAIRGESVSILDTIGGNTITAYKSRVLKFGPGVYVVSADALNFANDIGLVLKGSGSRGKTNYIHGATTLLVSGTSSGYGIRAYRNGGRSLTIMDMDICYATSGFTGSLIDVLDAPGLHLVRCYVGTYGITSGTRLQTAAALIRSTYDEFMTFDSCVFDGAVRGWWSDDTRTELANTFGGSVTSFNNCVFYDFSENHIYHGGSRTRQTLNLNGTIFNPIAVSPSSSCINIDNVEGLNLRGVQFTPSTTYAPASQWLRATNCTGTIDGSTFDDLAPAGLLSGKLSVNGNRIYCTSGFTLNQGIITGRSNEFSKGTSGWILSATAPLCVDLGPDEFKSDVTNSYYIPSDSSYLSGRVRYCYDLDASTAKFTNASSRVWIANDDDKDISVTATSYTVSIRDTGRTIVATGSATQTFTLPTSVAGTKLKFFKAVGQILNVTCAGGNNFYTGSGAVMSSAQSAAVDVGGYLELESYGTSGWKVVSQVGTWTYS